MLNYRIAVYFNLSLLISAVWTLFSVLITVVLDIQFNWIKICTYILCINISNITTAKLWYLEQWYLEYNGFVKVIWKSQPFIYKYFTLDISKFLTVSIKIWHARIVTSNSSRSNNQATWSSVSRSLDTMMSLGLTM